MSNPTAPEDAALAQIPELARELPAEATVAAARRSIVAGEHVPAGHIVQLAELWWLRPGDGMQPGREGELAGRPLARDVSFGEPLSPDHVS